MEPFAQVFTQVLEQSGVTQYRAAKLTGLAQQTLSAYMRGEQEPKTLETWVKLLKAFPPLWGHFLPWLCHRISNSK